MQILYWYKKKNTKELMPTSFSSVYNAYMGIRLRMGINLLLQEYVLNFFFRKKLFKTSIILLICIALHLIYFKTYFKYTSV